MKHTKRFLRSKRLLKRVILEAVLRILYPGGYWPAPNPGVAAALERTAIDALPGAGTEA